MRKLKRVGRKDTLPSCISSNDFLHCTLLSSYLLSNHSPRPGRSVLRISGMYLLSPTPLLRPQIKMERGTKGGRRWGCVQGMRCVPAHLVQEQLMVRAVSTSLDVSLANPFILYTQQPICWHCYSLQDLARLRLPLDFCAICLKSLSSGP